MEQMIDILFLAAGLLFGSVLQFLVLTQIRLGSFEWLRNRMAKILIRKYNRGIPLTSQEQQFLDFFIERGVIRQAYLERKNPKHYRLMLDPKAAKS